MKYVRSLTFRALCAMGVGALLVAFPDKTTSWLVAIVGVLFLIPGLVSVIAYFKMRMTDTAMRPFFPIVGTGSFMFGLLLVAFSDRLVEYMLYVLAVFLVLAGVSQIVNMLKIRHHVHVGVFFYIAPLLITLSGIFVIVYPKEVLAVFYTIVGVTSIIYGIEEMLSAIHFRKVRRLMAMEVKKEETTDEAAAEDTIRSGDIIDFSETDDSQR
ncbi:MAG TPA: hypothetical protein DEQ84_03650 [Prevotellaceae bacterium]|nr:hypothetical protein [Prevotellaceae bacterium]